ncbi:MAG TPA: radical SAM protein [Anaeromyxobacteraceae bacterium]|nr:radical SAM protein [Anaeromyxobacteraceae bacterium]
MLKSESKSEPAAPPPPSAGAPTPREIDGLLTARNFERAQALIERRIAVCGADAESLNGLGYIRWQLGAREEALGFFQKGAIADPEDRGALRNFFDAACVLKSFEMVEAFLRARPGDHDAPCLLADCMARQGQGQAAARILDEVLARRPDHEGALKLRGQIGAQPRVPAGPGPATEGTHHRYSKLAHITRRGCIDVGHPCDINCLFCYHRFEDKGARRFLPAEEIMHRLSRDAEHFGLTVTDFTGGEPSLHPQIVEIVAHGARIGNRICLISHGQWRRMDRIDRIIDAGVHEFLISIHGIEGDHDRVTNPGAFAHIMRSVEHLRSRGVRWRVNCVATALNAPNLPEYARQISTLPYPPYNANFIVFSPLAGWHGRGLIDFQARHSDLAPHLASALDIFLERGIWSNVRYYPMCMLPGRERHVTCFPQICYDPFEWDYRSYCNLTDQVIENVRLRGEKCGIPAGSPGHLFFNTWSLLQSQRLYRHGPACIDCRLRFICDGVAEQYRSRFGFDELCTQPGEAVRDPIFFRRAWPQAVGSKS